MHEDLKPSVERSLKHAVTDNSPTVVIDTIAEHGEPQTKDPEYIASENSLGDDMMVAEPLAGR